MLYNTYVRYPTYIYNDFNWFICLFFFLFIQKMAVPYSIWIRNKELDPYSLLKSNKELGYN